MVALSTVTKLYSHKCRCALMDQGLGPSVKCVCVCVCVCVGGGGGGVCVGTTKARVPLLRLR